MNFVNQDFIGTLKTLRNSWWIILIHIIDDKYLLYSITSIREN